jgi:hypothetical protein
MADTVSTLTEWANFYVIAGSSAGALTGLQFVVIALIKDTEHVGSMLEVRAFGSPTIVHFCAVLVISALASAPWHNIRNAATAFAVLGAVGILYALTVVRHAYRQSGYTPDAEDWFWYIALPLLSYSALVTSAVLLSRYVTTSMFAIGAVSLLLLLVGIHNSWDSVTYIAVGRAESQAKAQRKPAK